MGNGNGTVLSQEGEGNSVKETSLMMEICEREREREKEKGVEIHHTTNGTVSDSTVFFPIIPTANINIRYT
jgi:hypothetical protein